MSSFRGKTFFASGFHAPEWGQVEYFADALLAIDSKGSITSILKPGDEFYAQTLEEARLSGRLEILGNGKYLIPGFVDLHVHAPQYPQLGNALDEPLEVWLHKYTFPLESRYCDAAFAERAYRLLVRDLLANGTTTALYFATVHQDATRRLADICLELGQRALIGKVAMDHPENCPDFYRDETPDAAVAGTSALIDYIRHHPDNGEALVHPVITPRFIPACTDAALAGLGALAKECGCHVQTHASESDWAHGYVLGRYGVTDTVSLDRFGLLDRLSVLAHSNFITEDDMELIRIRQAAVAHCPISNAWFAGAVFPLRAAVEKGLHVGLGSDVSGGYSGSLLENCRAAIMASRMFETGVEPDLEPGQRSKRAGARIGFREAFHLATAGGAKALDLPVGRFEPGCQFDALVVDTDVKAGTIRLFDDLDTPETILEKIIMTASRANIARVFIGGRLVSGD